MRGEESLGRGRGLDRCCHVHLLDGPHGVANVASFWRSGWWYFDTFTTNGKGSCYGVFWYR